MIMNIFSLLLISLFTILLITHYIFAYQRIIKKKSGYSYVPLLNGVIGGIGFYLAPMEFLNSMWWIAFIIDWGCMPLLVEYLFNKLLKN